MRTLLFIFSLLNQNHEFPVIIDYLTCYQTIQWYIRVCRSFRDGCMQYLLRFQGKSSHKPTSRLYPGSNRARLWEPFRVSMIILIVTGKTIIPPTKQQKKKKLKPLIRYRDIAFTSKFAYATWCHLVYDKLKRGE